MRFVPRNKEVNSPRRRRPGSIGHGPYMPPVLARLPEIEAEPEKTVEEDKSYFIDGKEGKKFRVDGAHPSPEQSAPEPPALSPPAPSQPAPETLDVEEPVAPVAEPTTAISHGEILAAAPYPAEISSAIDSLAVENQIVSAGTTTGPTLPALQTAGFSETAAKIMAQLESAQIAKNESTSLQVQSEPVAETEPTTATEPQIGETAARNVSSSVADRHIRIDPGIPKPVARGSKTNDPELDQKRRIARGQTPPELDVLDSPWHDWIVKLGGTFIAGLLLIAAFQAIQPKSNVQHAGADPQIDAGRLTSPALNDDRFVSAPPVQEPGTFDPVLDVVAPPAEPTGDPVFVDPDELDSLVDDANNAADGVQPGYEAVEIATTSPEPSTTPMPTLDELAGELMPAPAVEVAEDTILPMPSDDGQLNPEVAAVIENNLVAPDSATEVENNTPAMIENSLAGQTNSLFGPPSTDLPAQSEPVAETRVARNDNSGGPASITPIANPESRYPTTGYAPVTRFPRQQQPIVLPQQSFAPQNQQAFTPQQQTFTPQQQTFTPQQQAFTPQQHPFAPQQQVQQQPIATPQPTRPQFNMFPQAGRAAAPVQPGVARGFVPHEPRSPMSVQLNGTIQQYSR